MHLSLLRGFAHLDWRLFLVYCAALHAASLRGPLALPGTPAWDLLVNDNSGVLVFPMLAVVWSAVWCVLAGRDRLFRMAGACVLLIMLAGMLLDWKFGAYPIPTLQNRCSSRVTRNLETTY